MALVWKMFKPTAFETIQSALFIPSCIQTILCILPITETLLGKYCIVLPAINNNKYNNNKANK